MASKVVLLVDSREWMRRKLHNLFADDPCVTEVYEVTSIAAAQRMWAFRQVDLVVMQQKLITETGLFPPGKLLVLAAELNTDILLNAYTHGALGYLLESALDECFNISLRLLAGQFLLDPTLVASGMKTFIGEREGAKGEELTRREREVLALLQEGYSNQDIALRLFISETTVKTHVAHIYSKLDLKGRGARLGVAKFFPPARLMKQTSTKQTLQQTYAAAKEPEKTAS